MQLQERINVLVRLGEYMQSNEDAWLNAKQRAYLENNWFIPTFIDKAVQNISTGLLQREALEDFAAANQLDKNGNAKRIGIALIGSVPLQGFHDILCVFLTGHIAVIKASSKDEALIKHLIGKLHEWSEETQSCISIAAMLKGCDAYIATETRGATLSFEQYFKKYPSIIRKHKTSAAILNGTETNEELEKLAEDIHLYFGLGSNSVAKLYVPDGYDFIRLLTAFKQFENFSNHHKFKNNYDHNLSLQILNNKYYMTNGSILLVESKALTSPISQLNYEFYVNEKQLIEELERDANIELIIGKNHTPFGEANSMALTKFENGINTINFLKTLS